MTIRDLSQINSSPFFELAGRTLSHMAMFFAGRSVDSYIVGGFLRDLLLGRSSGDIDIVVDTDPNGFAEELAGILGGTHIRFNNSPSMVRIVVPGSVQENPKRLEWQIDISYFQNDIRQDLASRDFTVNALALPLKAGFDEMANENIIDPFGGISDMRNSRIKMISDMIFAEDPIRLLRALRISTQLGFLLDSHTSIAIERNAHLVSHVSQERIRDEFLKILSLPDATRNMYALDHLGLLCRVIPELEDLKGVSQPKEHHYWDVFHHSIQTTGAIERAISRNTEQLSVIPWHPYLDRYFDEEVSDGCSRSTIIKLAGLLHDVAKPVAKSFDINGRIRFIGHDEYGSKVSSEILRRLRVSNKGIHLVSKMIKYHLRPTQISQRLEMPTQRALFRYARDLGEIAIDTLFLNLGDYLAANGPVINDINDWYSHCALIGDILFRGLIKTDLGSYSKKGLVDGNDIMDFLRLPPSRAIGQILELVDEAYGSGEIESKEEALELARMAVLSIDNTTN